MAGAEEASKAGQLTVMIGGAEEGFQKAEPFLDAYAKAAELMGPNGHGQLTKMVNQIMISANMQGLAEGIVMGQETGLDMEKVLRLLGQGSAQSWWLDNRGGADGDRHTGRLRWWHLQHDEGPGHLPQRGPSPRDITADHVTDRPVLCCGRRLEGGDRWESTSLITLWDSSIRLRRLCLEPKLTQNVSSS